MNPINITPKPMNFGKYNQWTSPTRLCRVLAAIALLSALAPQANAQIYQFYWKDNANNGNWDWGGSQWFSSQTSGNVGAPNYNGGEQLYFENTGNTTTTINAGGGTGGAPAGWIGLNAIFTQNASSGKVYTINSGGGINGIFLYNKIETLNVGTAAGLIINSAIRLGSAITEINAVSADIQLAALDLNGNTLNSYGNKNLKITGVISGIGNYNIQNQGITVTYSGASANTFSGTTTVKNTSTLILNKSANTAAIAGFLTVDSGAIARTDAANQLNNQLVTANGTLNLNNNNQSAALAGSGSVSLGSATLTINNTASDTFSGTISGTGSIIKSGAGTEILSGANTYTGGTTVSVGKLLVNNTSGSGTGTNTVSVTGGILGGTGIIGGATTISSGAIHTAGDAVTLANVSGAGTIGKETFSTGITYNQGSIFEWNLTGNTDSSIGTRGSNYDAVNTASLATTGTKAIFRVVLNAGQDFSESFWNSDRTWSDIFTNVAGNTNLNIASIFSSAVQYYNASGVLTNPAATQGSFSFSGTDLNWTAVPEPSSALAGLLLAAGLLRRRR